MQGKRMWQVVLVMALVVLWGYALPSLRSDGGSGDPQAAGSKLAAGQEAAASELLSPAETVLVLQERHGARDYDGMAALIVAEHREPFSRLIRAADAVIDANAQLKHDAESRYGGPMGRAWDLSSMRNNLGPLSKDLHLINQRFRGDTAIVTLQEGDNVPLVRAVFRNEDGSWRYDPESVPQKVTEELWQLAYMINDVDAAVRSGSSFEDYFDSFMRTILPQMARVATIREVSEASVASSASSAD